MNEENQRILLTIDNSKLDKDDDWSEVVKQIESLKFQWRTIGRNLHVKPDKIKEIAENHPQDCETCLGECVLEWLKGNYNTKKFGEPSWRGLAEVVVELDSDLFKKIADAHKTSPSCPIWDRFWTRKLTLPSGQSRPSAIPLVIPDNFRYNNSTNKLTKVGVNRTSLKLNEDALNLLRGIRKPVAVLSVCGPYRSGKSYLLSRMLGTSKAFHVSPKFESCTHGIWMGTTVLECEDHVIVLLDTEGIDAVGGSQSSDASILVMSILLSSYMIYNSIGIAKNTDLEKIQTFAKISSSILVKQGSTDNVLTEFRHYFPNFMWLFRDITSSPVDEDGHKISAHDYLIKKVLSCNDKFDRNKEVKQAILAYFPTTECVMLPPPSADPEVMEDIENNEHKLTTQFNEGIQNLVKDLSQQIPTKCGYHSPNPMTGETLADLATVYIKAINQPDAVPCLDNNWKTVISLELTQTVRRLVVEYDQEMEAATASKLPMEFEIESQEASASKSTSLMDIHRKIFEKKMIALISQTEHLTIDESENIREQHIDNFIDEIVQYEDKEVEDQGMKDSVANIKGGLLYKYVQCNYEISRDDCICTFDKSHQPIIARAKKHSPGYTVEAFEADLEKARQMYIDEAVGPAKWEVLESKQQLLSDTLKYFKTIKKKKKQLVQEKSRAKEAVANHYAAEVEVRNLNTIMEKDRELHKKLVDHQEREYQRRLENLERILINRIEQENRKRKELHEALFTEAAALAASNEQRLKDELQRRQHEMNQQLKQVRQKSKKRNRSCRVS